MEVFKVPKREKERVVSEIGRVLGNITGRATVGESVEGERVCVSMRQRLLLSGTETVSGVVREGNVFVLFVLFCLASLCCVRERERERKRRSSLRLCGLWGEDIGMRWHCGSGVGTWDRERERERE